MFENFPITTPAFIYDESRIADKINNANKLLGNVGGNLLFPLKSFTIIDGLRLMAPIIYGFAVSSLFEAKLARHVLGENKTIHITTPGLRPDEIKYISKLCDYVSYNSFSQFKQYSSIVGGNCSSGIRINPQLSFVKDERYNPCREYSKLGVSFEKLAKCNEQDAQTFSNINGILFHTNCESNDFSNLMETVLHIEKQMPHLLEQVEWVNLGGGYLFEDSKNAHLLPETIGLLKDKYKVDVFFEPGKEIVGDAGYIVSTVLDLFESDGAQVAILDTSLNHIPEAFEYQFEPYVMSATKNGKYDYVLAGATCLAGDIFGEYSFDEQLEVGSRVVFEDMGAYTLVKAHMFNGVNLPSIYAYSSDNKIRLLKHFTYENFLSKYSGGKQIESKRN